MIANVTNLLYRQPELYELVYPEPNDETPAMLRRAFARYLPRLPESVLDIGCGTGRDLASLSRDIADCVGIDALSEMVSLASARRRDTQFILGDMRTVRLERTFDAVLCMGSALMYALSNSDLCRAFQTFAAHARQGTMLFLDVNNAAACLPGGTFQLDFTREVSAPAFRATASGSFSFDHRRQLLIRRRVWNIEGHEAIEDYCEYRLLFPAELESWLEWSVFEVVGMHDNKELVDSSLTGPRLYASAIYQGRA